MSSQTKKNSTDQQFSTFFIADRLYGIDVTEVQEIVKPMPTTTVPLAPNYVRGLINLRGQVATAIGLRELFQIAETPPEHFMNVVCKVDGSLLSLNVDEIADVMDVNESSWEPTPQTIPEEVKRFMSGVFKVEGHLLSIISIEKIVDYLNNSEEKVAA